MQSDAEEAFRQLYRSGIRGSYFGAMQNPTSIRKSNVQADFNKKSIEEVDEKTFRLKHKFVRPQSNQQTNYQGKCYLDKESFFSCFSRRKLYDIVLRSAKLSISYHNQIKRFVDFNAVSATLDSRSSSFKLHMDKSEEFIYVEPESRQKDKQAEETQLWSNLLHEAIDQSVGKQKKYTYLAEHCTQFYKTEQVTNNQFEKSANSGDILLFRSPHSAARLQRIFTDSEYDHVGIILRNSKNQLFIYESTSFEGVGLTPWKDMIKYEWYEETEKICWRPLNMELGEKEIDIIQTYVVKTLGKEFGLNLDKLFMFKSKLKRTDEEEEKKTYFCSELAARLYKELGILDENKSSSTYYPVDFSQKGSLNIVKPGVSLGHERIISFDGL